MMILCSHSAPTVRNNKQTARYHFRGKRALTCGNIGGRYWDRTSDLFRVREARSRCANRPRTGAEVETGFEPVYTALQAVASPLGHSTELAPHVTCGGLSERTTGFEPATLTLAR
jgi:hypothetical protein